MMRKTIFNRIPRESLATDQRWLDIEPTAEVQITSEDAEHPIESVLAPGEGLEWRASEAGEQTIRLLFDKPQSLKRIYLVFEDDKRERTQEFVLRWSPGAGGPFRDIVRQQYTFSPTGATREVEDYAVDLDRVTALELKIVPDRRGGGARASLSSLLLA
jgi:hypothetical protein